MTQRRYGDEQVREILSLAATNYPRDESRTGDAVGFTLEQLQRIGQDAGIEPARIAKAAEMLDALGKQASVRKSFGVPTAVSLVVDLPRAPTDREWEQLVSEFRSVFGVQGRLATTGGIRDWSHGNLHISVEPTARGEQFRLSTMKQDAVALNGIGFAFLGMAALMGTVVAIAGKPEKSLPVMAMFGGIALLSFFGAQLFRAPVWARTRKHQMEAIAELAVKLLS
jgi:hypothetical protein